MATSTSQRKKQTNGVLKDAAGHVTQTAEATVTEKPSRGEVILDVALLAAGALEAISPPAAVVGIAVNRLVRVAK
jgi:predicted Zn-dependent protease